MGDKTPDELVAGCNGCVELAPARRLARLAARTCLVGCGLLVAIPVGLIVFGFVWQWRLNRNPDPFPWRPESEWTLANVSTAWDFVEEDGSLIMLRWDYSSDRSYPPVPSVVRCDVETGRILSEGALPFPAMALAVSSSSDSLLIVVVPPAPHDSMPRPVRQAPDERLPLRRHVLRMARLRLPDWAVEAETEVEIKYSGSSYELGYSLRVVAMPSRRAWVVGIDGPDEDEYRVSFRDEKTLAEIASCSVPSQLHSRYRGIALDTGNPSRVLIGLQDWDGYRWDSWDTDSGEVTFTRVPLGNGLPSRTGPGWDFWGFGLPHGVGLSEFVVGGGARDAMSMNALSPGGAFAARSMSSKPTASMPVPLPPMRTDLAIWRLAPEKLIVVGKLQGEEYAIIMLRFSKDNRFLVTGHEGGTIRIWKLPTPEPQ